MQLKSEWRIIMRNKTCQLGKGGGRKGVGGMGERGEGGSQWEAGDELAHNGRERKETLQEDTVVHPDLLG